MNIEQKVEKVKDIIKSCETESQLRVAVKMFNHLLLNHGKEVDKEDFHKMKNLIGLMKKKCLETEEVNEEMSKIGQEFRKHASMSGEPSLQKISFSEENEDILKEINIGTQIEQNHLPLEDAKALATQNVNEIPDYYTNPNFCIIAVENKEGNKKTIRVEKDIYEKSKEGKEQLLLADMEIFHENLDMNDITQSLRDQLKKDNSKKFTKDEIFKEIKRRRDIEMKRREEEENDNWPSLMDDGDEIEESTLKGGEAEGMTLKDLAKKHNVSVKDIEKELEVGTEIEMEHTDTKEMAREIAMDHVAEFPDYYTNKKYGVKASEKGLEKEEEIEEATGSAGSNGQYTGLFSGGEPISRTIKKGDIPVSVNGMSKPIGKMSSLNVLEEDEELEEAVDYAAAVGSYETPAMWAKNKSNWRGAHKLTYPGGKFVNIKKKCKNYPYCNQGAGSVTLSDTSDMEIDNVFNVSENKIVKKKNLKIKK